MIHPSLCVVDSVLLARRSLLVFCYAFARVVMENNTWIDVGASVAASVGEWIVGLSGLQRAAVHCRGRSAGMPRRILS